MGAGYGWMSSLARLSWTGQLPLLSFPPPPLSLCLHPPQRWNQNCVPTPDGGGGGIGLPPCGLSVSPSRVILPLSLPRSLMDGGAVILLFLRPARVASVLRFSSALIPFAHHIKFDQRRQHLNTLMSLDLGCGTSNGGGLKCELQNFVLASDSTC